MWRFKSFFWEKRWNEQRNFNAINYVASKSIFFYFGTDFTFVGLFSGVDIFVCCAMCLLRKCLNVSTASHELIIAIKREVKWFSLSYLFAIFALIGLLSRMNSHVILQSRAATEALKREEINRLNKCYWLTRPHCEFPIWLAIWLPLYLYLWAILAMIGPLSCVNAHVNLQRQAASETLKNFGQ